DLSLVDAWQLVLHWVLDGGDVLARFDELAKGCIQSGSFPAAGRARNQNQPLRAPNDLAKCFQHLTAHAERQELEFQRTLLEHPKHDLFAVNRRKRGGAEIQLASANRDPEPAGLR